MANVKNKTWYRLDSSGYMYPMIKTGDTQSLFALSARLDEDVDPVLLDRAVNDAFRHYPYFKIKLKHGLFRYYFAENEKEFRSVPDSGRILESINFRKNNGYPFRISYYKRTVRLEIFHAVSDGRGAAEFFKTILIAYLRILHGEMAADDCLNPEVITVADEEFEDAYMRYSKESGILRAAKSVPETAVPIRGKQLKSAGFGITTGILNADSLKNKAKEYDCSVTEYLTAAILLAIAETRTKNTAKKKLIGFIPVDLRGIFPSKTMRNFVTFAFAKIDPDKTEPTLAAFTAAVKRDLRAFLTDEESAAEKVSVTTLLSRQPVLRFLPQVVKTAVVRAARAFGSPTQSMIVSNLCVAKFPDDVAKHVEEFCFYLNCNRRSPKNAAAVSCGGKCYLTFSRRILNENIEARCFEIFKEDGLEVEVVSNERVKNGRFPADEERFKIHFEKGIRYKSKLNEWLFAAATIISLPVLVVGTILFGTAGVFLRVLTGKKLGFFDL